MCVSGVGGGEEREFLQGRGTPDPRGFRGVWKGCLDEEMSGVAGDGFGGLCGWEGGDEGQAA
jgi:hypothetical protein